MKKFLICANSRTGSNLIQDGIRQTKVMQTEGEALNNDVGYAESGLGPREFLQGLADKCDKPYWGIKYMSWWLNGEPYLRDHGLKPIYDVFDKDTKLIITDRRNFVKRAFSNMLSIKNNGWWYQANSDDTVEFQKFELKPAFVEYSHKQQQLSIRLMLEHYPNALHLYYEDYTESETDLRAIRSKVIDFISDGEVQLSHEKQIIHSKRTPITRPPRDFLTNLKEIEDRYGKGVLD